MTGRPSPPALLAVHGLRVLGHGTAARVAQRYRLGEAEVEDLLLDAEAVGHVRRNRFAGDETWSLTEAGRADGERRLAAELDAAGGRDVLVAVHADFLPLNRRLAQASTDWQVRPERWDPLARNDHSDHAWDDRVLDALVSIGRALDRIGARLADVLTRFERYPELYAAALEHALAGRHAWVDAPDRDSLHLVWIQLHEDLLATLGILRGTDDPLA